MGKRYVAIFAIIATIIGGCDISAKNQPRQKGDDKMGITVSSPAFEEGGMIPSEYTCDGENMSPPIHWEGIPEEAKSIAVISDDPDAPVGTWVHWVIWNIPHDSNGLAKKLLKEKVLPNGTKQGINDFGKYGYGGPCPPSGTHRYYFKVYALDIKLEISNNSKKKDLLKAMDGHILAEGELMGRYKRQR